MKMEELITHNTKCAKTHGRPAVHITTTFE